MTNIQHYSDIVNEKNITDAPELVPVLEERVLDTEVKRMTEAMYEKVDGALDHMIKNLLVAADKYMTYRGFDTAYNYLKQYNHPDPLAVAAVTAFNLSNTAKLMVERARKIKKDIQSVPDLTIAESLSNFCDDFYSDEFINDVDAWMYEEKHSHSVIIEQIAVEAMRIDLCTNVGSAAQDIADFIMQAKDEIDKVAAEAEKKAETED